MKRFGSLHRVFHVVVLIAMLFSLPAGSVFASAPAKTAGASLPAFNAALPETAPLPPVRPDVPSDHGEVLARQAMERALERSEQPDDDTRNDPRWRLDHQLEGQVQQPVQAPPLPAETSSQPQSQPQKPDQDLVAVQGFIRTADGLPQPGLKVAALLPDGTWASAAANVDGVFSILLPPDAGTQLQVFDARGASLALENPTTALVNAPRPGGMVRHLVLKSSAAELQLASGSPDMGYLAAGEGQIQGTVTSSVTGLPIPNVEVYLQDTITWAGFFTFTDANGQYTFASLNDSTYRVQFRAVPGVTEDDNYIRQYYNNKPTDVEADLLTITDGNVITGIDAVMLPGGQLTGQVVSDGDQNPLQDVWVYLYDGNYALVYQMLTGSSGSFSFSGLPTGTYYLGFFPTSCDYYPSCLSKTYIGEYYNDVDNTDAAQPITIIAGQVTSGITGSLAIGGSVTGLVTNDDAQPISGIQVYASMPGFSYSTNTQLDGTYLLTGLPTGSYTLSFTDYSGVYATEFYNNQYFFEHANQLNVTQGETLDNINAVLSIGGQISGTVTGEDTGLPVANFGVALYNLLGQYSASTSTSEEGNYLFPGLAPGSYKIQFNGYDSQYMAEYYDNRDALETADWIEVYSDAVTTGIDAALSKGASISGQVTADDSGAPLNGINVYLTDQIYGYNTTTNASGEYSFSGLSAGSYTLSFTPPGCTTMWCPDSFRYLPEYYNGKLTQEQADPIQLADSEAKTINAGLQRGSVIRGQVSAETGGLPLFSSQVNLLTADGSNQYLYWANTDSAGQYVFVLREPGQYIVQASAPYSCDMDGCHQDNYIGEYYQDALTYQNATPVMVLAGQEVTGIDFALADGGIISGVVTSALDSQPVGGLSVIAVAQNGSYSTSVQTNANGEYWIRGLPAQDYIVQFSLKQICDMNGCVLGYLDQFYNNRDSMDQADLVPVVQGTTTTNINAAMRKGVSIRGRVTSAVSGSGLESVYIDVLDAAGTSAGYAYTDPQGYYQTTALVGGAYYLWFRTDGGWMPAETRKHAPEYYNDKTDFSSADAVVVAGGTDVTGIDAALAHAGIISGRVTAADSGSPINGIGVYLYNQYWSYIQGTQTDADGNYAFNGLLPGIYTMQFYTKETSWSSYVSEYYKGKLDTSQADWITLTAGQQLTGMNAELDPGGSISGRVIAAQGGAPVQFVDVEVYRYTVTNGYWYMSSAVTDAQGDYTLTGLAEGDYRVSFYPQPGIDFLREHYNNQPSVNTGNLTLVHVTPPAEVQGIDAALDAGVHFEGSVTSDVDGQPLPSINIAILNADGLSAGYGWTDGSGSYKTNAVPAGSYHVMFEPSRWGPYSSREHAPEYYNNQPTLAAADVLDLTLGTTLTGINASLALGGKVSGVVTASDNGVPLPGVEVYLQDWDTGYSSNPDITTAQDGSYEIIGLAAGGYRLRFSTTNNAPIPTVDYVGEYYSGGYRYDQATQILVSSGQTIANIDASLERGARLTGMVTSENGSLPLSGVFVELVDPNDHYYLGYGETNEAGSYTTGAVPPGQYRVVIYPDIFGPSAAYIAEYHENTTDYRNATPVNLPAGQATTLNAALALGGRINGQVRAGDTGLPLPYVRVLAHAVGGNSFIKAAYTDLNGFYSIQGLGLGSYKIEFIAEVDSWRYAREWYNNRTSFSNAHAITVSSLAPINNINTSLELGGQISGLVTDAATGQPLPGTYIYAQGLTTDASGYSMSDIDGTYTLYGLPADDYQVSFWLEGYVDELYNNSHSLWTATYVPVTPGITTPDINAAMETGGEISGQVTGMDGVGLSSLVTIYDSGGSEVSTTITTEEGYYTLQLIPGSYKVMFRPDNSESQLAPQYYQNAYSLEDATPVVIVDGVTTENIDGVLQPGGQIGGQVTGEAGHPLANIEVQVINAAGEVAGVSLTGPDGAYVTPNLHLGDYRLKFEPAEAGGSQAYISEYYQDQPSLDAADSVHVNPGALTEEVDAVLSAQSANFSAVTLSQSEGVANALMQLTLSQPVEYAVDVPFHVSGSAAAGTDHDLVDGVVTFAPNEVSKDVTFHITNDSIPETNEIIQVRLLAGKYNIAGQNNLLTVTIEDNDVKPPSAPAPVVDSVLPAQGRQGLPVEIMVSGSFFTQGSVIKLTQAAATTPVSTRFVSTTILTATIPSEIAEGVYGVAVTNPDGKQAGLAAAYRVLPALTDDLFAYTYDLWTAPADLHPGEAVTMGLVVHRQGGGYNTLQDVRVAFYLGNPSAGGTLIGYSQISELAPNGSVSTPALPWVVPAVGDYNLYAVIDSNNAVEETLETNNTIARGISVTAVPVAADVTAPAVTQFTINAGASKTSQAQITLNVKAVDPVPGSGVSQVLFYEYVFDENTQQWVQAQVSGWMPYKTTGTYDWNLTPSAGAKYMQAWVADGAGNISAQPLSRFINLIPASDTLARGQSRYFTFYLSAGESFQTVITPQSGDPDLYVWAPDFQFRYPWVGINSEGIDQVLFTAPVTGVYVIQVYGYSGSIYSMTADKVTTPLGLLGYTVQPQNAVVSGGKELLETPALEPDKAPNEQRAVESVVPSDPGEPDGFKVFLPGVRR